MTMNGGPVMTNIGTWCFTDYKKIKVIHGKCQRITFQRKGKYTRGLSISLDGFYNMDDVTLIPYQQLELESNIWLRNYGNEIHMVKYCMTKDNQRCDGGFFTFTPKEWIYFWKTLRPRILAYVNE